ncbi:hypothetical protein HAX54_051294, partial [Datura stramonium]|nr:hypothetical protein [Datura stramonium]
MSSNWRRRGYRDVLLLVFWPTVAGDKGFLVADSHWFAAVRRKGRGGGAGFFWWWCSDGLAGSGKGENKKKRKGVV